MKYSIITLNSMMLVLFSKGALQMHSEGKTQRITGQFQIKVGIALFYCR